jgi:hypothetical protein
MSAKENINPKQLRLFYTATQLQKALTTSDDLLGNETMSEMWNRKLSESKMPPHTGHGAGVYRSIRTKGWQPEGPFTVIHSGSDMRLYEGHHRVAVLAEMERKTGRSPFLYLKHANDRGTNFAEDSSDAGSDSTSVKEFKRKVKEDWGW